MCVRFAIAWIVTTLVALPGCSRDPRSGARIAESEDGPWIWMCSAQIQGPPRAEQRGVATGVGASRKAALREGLTAACTKAAGGVPCSSSTGGWKTTQESCIQHNRPDPRSASGGVANPESAGRPSYRCEVEVVRAAGPRQTLMLGEGRTREKACERARRRGCTELRGGAQCANGAQGWATAESVARRRP